MCVCVLQIMQCSRGKDRGSLPMSCTWLRKGEFYKQVDHFHRDSLLRSLFRDIVLWERREDALLKMVIFLWNPDSRNCSRRDHQQHTLILGWTIGSSCRKRKVEKLYIAHSLQKLLEGVSLSKPKQCRVGLLSLPNTPHPTVRGWGSHIEYRDRPRPQPGWCSLNKHNITIAAQVMERSSSNYGAKQLHIWSQSTLLGGYTRG